jgi:hypothetical protein
MFRTRAGSALLAVTLMTATGAQSSCETSTNKINAVAQFTSDSRSLRSVGDLRDCLTAFSKSTMTQLDSAEKGCLGNTAGQLNLLGSGLILLTEFVPDPRAKGLAAVGATMYLAADMLQLLAEDPDDPNYADKVEVTEKPVQVPTGTLTDDEYQAVAQLANTASREAALAEAMRTALNRASTARQADATDYETQRASQAREFAAALASALGRETELLHKLSNATAADQEIGDSDAKAVSPDDIAKKQQDLSAAGQLPPALGPYLDQLIRK